MEKNRLMNEMADYQKLNIDPDHIEAWEDGHRDSDDPGHGEIWYLDCSFDDKSTLVLGFRPKSSDHLNEKGNNPNVAINYSDANGSPFYDYRQYDPDQTQMSRKSCDVKFGPSTLIGNDWKSYDVHIEPEKDYPITMEGKPSTQHHSKIDLHFEAKTQPFRPGSGYISFGSNDEFYYNFICITKLDVTGSITIDGEEKTVSGSAYYNQQWFNISPIMAFHHWLWGRQNIGNYNVLIYDMVASEKYGFTQIPLLTIDDKDGNRVFENTSADNVQIKVLDSYIQKETGKRYPKTIRYLLKQKGIDVEYTISDPKEINVINLYDNQAPGVKEKYDSLNLHPTYTRYLANSTLSITKEGKTETSSGPILYEFNYAGIENKNAHLF